MHILKVMTTAAALLNLRHAWRAEPFSFLYALYDEKRDFTSKPDFAYLLLLA